MSRCFPFPPPGYVVNGIRDADEAMIDSIKGGEEKSKKEHKGKRDKKEKKEKKDKKKDKKRKEREGERDKHSHKRRRKEEEVAKDVQNKLKESESVCLEKSSLTVERELVQSTSQNSCDSTLNSNEKEKQKVTLNVRHNNKTDSSLNSNELLKDKEKKQPLNGRHNTNELLLKEKEKQLLNGRHNNNNNNNDSESIIRIRLPIRRPKDPEVTMMMITNKDQQPCPSQDIKLDSVAREQPQHPCSTSAPEHVSKRKDHTSKTKHKEKKLSSTAREALQFLNVVENYVPTTIESRVELTNSDEDECWWLVKKRSSNKIDTERSKQLNRNNETKQQVVMSTTWPRASLLPEADVYALPYTVPF